MANQIYALLVGIDRYANPSQAPHLRGCVADVEGTYSLLVQQFGVPEAHIRLLTARMDGREPPERLATRENIIQGWRTHLSQAGPGDHAFFHYSGHGSQARSIDPNEPDGYDETLVAHDSRTPGVYDIIDKELAALIREVEQRGAQVTVFLDCCHSGSGTRLAPSESAPRVRQCPPDLRERPFETLLPGLTPGSGTRGTRSPSGWVPLGNHLLLAGCRDEELSHEYQVPTTGQWQGVTSYFFHNALANLHPDMTWADLHDRVQTQVRAIYPSQSPQLEGPGHLTIFGGLGRVVERYLLVTQVEGTDYIQVNGGAAVGLTPGSRLAIYPPASTLEGEPLATALVEEVKVAHAWARLDRAVPVEPASRVRVTAWGPGEASYIVGVDAEPVRQAIATLADGQPSPFLQVVSRNASGPAPEVQVVSREGRYWILDPAGAPLVRTAFPVTPEGARQVAAALEHLAIYRNVRFLHNPAAHSALAGAVQVDAVTFTQLGRNYRPVDPAPIRGEGHEAVIRSGQNLLLTVTNRSPETLYLAVLELTPDFAIRRLYPPTRPHQTVAAGKAVPIPLRLTLDDPQQEKAVTIYKVLATREPTSFDVLQMGGLQEPDTRGGTRAAGNTALARLLNRMRHDGTRASELLLDDTDDSWTTAQLEVTVLSAAQSRALPPGQTRITVAEARELVLEKPAGLEGTLWISSLEQATRGLEGKTGLQLPPGLANPSAAAFFRPVTLGDGTRATDPSPAVLAIAAESAGLAQVSPEHPLRLELTVDDEPGLAGLVPVAFDGEFYFLAGRPAAVQSRSASSGQRRLAVTVEQLPPPVEEEADTRDLKRTARLFLYKIFAGDLPADAGLRRATLEQEQARFDPIRGDELSQARRVALMLHGFTGDSRWLVEKVWRWVQNNGNYDLCLTYDYESFGTGIRRNGELLAQALTGLGFGPDDGVHLDIYAHSMGTQVARALVELYGGAAYVDRVFMGGPPNAGSPLARARVLLPWLGNILVNLAGSVPPALIAHWLLGRLSESAQGLLDLEPDSDFYRALNDPARPPTSVPYFVQIGDNSASFQDWRKFSSKVMKGVDVALDLFFQDDNDLLVSLASARALADRWPNYQEAVLGINHFQYFYSPEGQRVLARWLS
ncbi:caspase family protein [Litorilinea aerophila]|uniref:Caspase family protein n=1 Tax=Litorilinea aerophila TaxID=1204385 RepID=A0A540VD52_9CHLR|nr:caspase family protein [Litorilinea aerophila]MCC9077557.1 caspase family protein [Litorilinea aerophila]